MSSLKPTVLSFVIFPVTLIMINKVLHEEHYMYLFVV